MPRNDLKQLSSRLTRPNPKLGKRIDLDSLKSVLDDPTNGASVLIDSLTTKNKYDNNTYRNIWVGSYCNDPVPFAVALSGPSGRSKSARSITRKGRAVDGSTKLGYARVTVDVGDIIYVHAITSLSPTAVIMRVTKFEENDKIRCEVLQVIVYDKSGEVKVYTHDTDAIFLRKIPVSKLEHVLEITKQNSIEYPKWYRTNISHLSPVKKEFTGKVDYSIGNFGTKTVSDANEFFTNLKKMAINFHITAQKENNESFTTRFYSSKSPLKLFYKLLWDSSGEESPEHTDKLKGVLMTAQIPYSSNLEVLITENNYKGFFYEPLVLLYSDSLKSLVSKVNNKVSTEGYIEEERILRL